MQVRKIRQGLLSHRLFRNENRSPDPKKR